MKHDPAEKKTTPDPSAFAGLRPGAMGRGKVRKHEKKMLLQLMPLGVLIVVIVAIGKPDWWPFWATVALVLSIFAAGLAIVIRGLSRPIR